MSAVAMLPPPMKQIFMTLRRCASSALPHALGATPHISRGPKMAVPTRTIVAPSAIAASRSSDMPIDSVSSA